MNGGVNGAMEEPVNTSLPSPPETILNQKKVPDESDSIVSNCENSSNAGDSHLDSDVKDEDPLGNNSNIGDEDHENSNSSKHDPLASSMVETTEKNEHVNSNRLQIINHNSNSNESYPESTSSSQGKSDVVEMSTNLSIEENATNGETQTNIGMRTAINQESEDEVDSEEDSSDEEESEMSAEPKADDTVSIISDSERDGGDETSQESQSNNKSNDIILLDNDNPHDSQNGESRSPEVHEIVSDNDDCMVASDEIVKSKEVSDAPLRRSSRTIKRIKYDNELENGEDESDIEEVIMEDPLMRKIPIVIKDTRKLVEMAAKQMKQGSIRQKKEPTLVIIDTYSKTNKSISKATFTIAAVNDDDSQNLYRNIVARGTTVIPVSVKNTASAPNSASSAQNSILPSLTDDMFVVEAPSFIVPYVYEKPSLKPFREFVDILGNELEEQKAQEEKERLEKEKEEKEIRDKERKERIERGEEVEMSEEENLSEEKDEKTPEEIEGEEKKKKKLEKKELRRRKMEEDDVSWDGESSSDSEDEILSDEDKTVVIKDKIDSINDIKDVSGLNADKVCTGKSDNYFDCSLGNFFINIGLNLVQEYVQNDLLKQQKRKLSKEKKTGVNTRGTETSIASLKKNLEFSQENNAPYSFTQKKCELCSFKTESTLAMAHHLETPHMKNNVYKCNFCAFEVRSPHDILYHMEAEHNTRGKLERAPAYHQCANCPFEDNGKGKLARHLISCAKKFKPNCNLSPPIEWEPPAKIPKITRSRNNMMGSYPNTFSRGQANNIGRPQINIGNMISGFGSAFRPRGRSPMTMPARATTVQGGPIIRGAMNNGKAPTKFVHQPSISITPLPRLPQPVPQPTQNKSTFVICEICDGYIKDLEQLRNHMQWIHKVKIHPKMIYNRPPLNCQKCQFRFFTDQGLERHLLGSHGLVTSSMQEAANKGKDAGRCPVCGRVYQWKLLNHVARDHSVTLKPAHLSYKCTVCTATFGMYKLFENHVYSAHSVVAKRVMDKSKTNTPTKATNDSLLKPLKINDEITIIPQSVKLNSPSATKDK